MDARRSLPSVDRLLRSDAFAALLAEQPRALVTAALQQELASARAALEQGSGAAEQRDDAHYAASVRAALERAAADTLVPVVNATGVVLHTNLGRAPLARAALDAIERTALGYTNLEYDLDTGKRGSRYAHCRDLLVRLTGAEDALVVNNNAAALVLALNTFARGLDAIISRGELVEIGGAFRVPEIMARSGAVLKEVGATNRTHASDYRAALAVRTGVLLKVHPSNFRIEGYTAETGIEELAALGREAGVPVVHDIGSGLMLPPRELGLPEDEPTPMASLAAGADIVTMSGDKLLGGPQCGIVLGRADLVDRMRRNPLCRALRVDKLTLAALSATLRLYLDPAQARQQIPVLRMLTVPADELDTRARALAARCSQAGVECRTMSATSAVGGGASPAAVLPTTLVQVTGAAIGASELERRLRTGDPRVVARVLDGFVCIDPRTLTPAQDAIVADAIVTACRE
jgi:L-seryl-tRNA(Ser) seleniumtransferase